MMTHHPKFILFVLFMVLLSLQAPANAEKIKLIKTRSELNQWVINSVQCADDFFPEVQNETFSKRFKKLGVTVTDIETEGPPSGSFRLPDKIKLYGFEGDTVTYWGDSGSEIYLKVQASVQELKTAMHTITLPAEINKHSQYQSGIWTQPPTEENPYPNLIFIRATSNKNMTEVGCRMFDY